MAKQRNRTTDPVLLPSDHGPEAIPQTGRVTHGMHRSIPWLINGVHIVDPDVDEVIKSGVVQRHVIGTTVQLVFMESHQASVIDQVVH